MLDWSFTDASIMRLNRAGDVLLKHQEAIDAAPFERVRTLFGLETTVTLYDLINTYFEGVEAANPKAKRGHSTWKPQLVIRKTLESCVGKGMTGDCSLHPQGEWKRHS